MTRDHFSKMMRSPYFQNESYANNGGKIEDNIEGFFTKIKIKIKFYFFKIFKNRK